MKDTEHQDWLRAEEKAAKKKFKPKARPKKVVPEERKKGGPDPYEEGNVRTALF